MNSLKMIMTVVALSFFAFGTLSADEISKKKRLAIVKALKNKGTIGENNKGLLSYRVEKKIAEKIVTAENLERLKTYKEIAKKQKVSVDFVGKARAEQIAKSAEAGTWIQQKDGTWKKSEAKEK